MRKIRILAIDDDPLQREMLRSQIEEMGHLIIDVVHQPEEFKRLAVAALPELLIIDIDLKLEITGIDLAEEILELREIPIIFLSGIQETNKIKDAIARAPVAFITKPYDELSLFAALEMAAKHLSKPEAVDDFLTTSPEGVFIKNGHYLIRILFDDLMWIEVQEKDCTLHCGSEKHVLRMRLKDLLKQLPKEFLQIHRSYAINLKHLKKIDTRNMMVELNSEQIPFSRNYRNELTEAMRRI